MQRVVRFGLIPPPSLPHGHPQRPPLISAGMPQHPSWLSPAGYDQQVYVGAVGERHAKRRRVDNQQHPSRPSAQQQHMVGILPQDQDQAQAHWHAQQANVATTLPWHNHGYSPIYNAPNVVHYAPANVPTQSPTHAVHIFAAHPHWTTGGSHLPNSGPAVYPHPTQMQTCQHIPPPLATPSQASSSQISEPSYESPYLARTNLTAQNETPNFGVGPSGSDINIGGASTNGEPTLPSQWDAPNLGDKPSGGQDLKPSNRPAHHAARKSPPVGHEGDIMLLQQRCRRQGAGEDVIGLIPKIFASGVNLEALTRPLTDLEVETLEFGVRSGKVYTAFLAPTNEEEGVPPRYACRLCHRDQAWKHSKDALRHLRRDHFGLADVCKNWCVFQLSTLANVNVCCWEMQPRKVLYERRNDKASL